MAEGADQPEGGDWSVALDHQQKPKEGATMTNGIDDRIVEKLRKVLALTTSPMEGEAQAAAAMLEKLLTEHNLSMADLEMKGANAPKVKEEGHDLGKAAFTWKLDLAEGIAKHYYCHPLVDRKAKTVRFIGRPDNMESLQMLYKWLIDQIKRISSYERKAWMEDHQEHVDPLRWQVNFGIGAAKRLVERLEEKARKNREDSSIMALVVHHDTEISDYLEKMYGWRTDGKKTAREQEREERWAKEEQEREELKARDLEEYYRRYPWNKPKTEEEKAADEKWQQEWEKKRERKEKARARYYEKNGWRGGRSYREPTDEELRRERQGDVANRVGHKAGGKINLDPFVEGEGKARKQVG